MKTPSVFDVGCAFVSETICTCTFSLFPGLSSISSVFPFAGRSHDESFIICRPHSKTELSTLTSITISLSFCAFSPFRGTETLRLSPSQNPTLYVVFTIRISELSFLQHAGCRRKSVQVFALLFRSTGVDSLCFPPSQDLLCAGSYHTSHRAEVLQHANCHRKSFPVFARSLLSTGFESLCFPPPLQALLSTGSYHTRASSFTYTR